ncbi:unnamed protein product [Sphagnum jensenii]|uniref:DNA primase large subunit n=1 Tax=Sphagnum jensenii TaxID=128206 RepID=A0ABP1APS3_9BRYO
MEFKTATNRRLSNAASTGLYGTGVGGGGAGAGGGASRLSLYQVAPCVEVSIEEFEQFALDRLRVLKAIEENRARGRRLEEVEAVVNDLWRKHMRTPNAADAHNKDMISHFVLRLVYCRTEELRRWFLGMETTLFRQRFRSETPESQRRFMEECKLPYKAINTTEFEAVKDKLGQVARSLNQPLPTGMVPFEEVPELVASRRVFLQRGNAFVPRDQLVAIVSNHFRARLSKALVLTNRKWTATIAEEEKDRLTPIVEALSTRYLGPDYSQLKSKTTIGLQDLDSLAQRSFPLCMRHLYTKVKEDHHLRHGGRQQLGLFLKGAGLKLEDALAFWRAEFSQKMGVEKFDKEYSYNVRHNYGREGKRTDYTPYSCMKIIMATPGVGDHHGCPFRHFSQENLHAVIGGLRLNAHTVDDIMGKVRNHHYQLACAATFEGVHGCQCDGINHPNQYFEQSQKVLNPQLKSGGDDLDLSLQGMPVVPNS